MNGMQPFDEMVDGHGSVRPYWRGLLSTINELGRFELLERSGRIALPGGATCDAVPLLLDRKTFADLEKGLIERAGLLDLMLADLYGPKRLLTEGAVPAALVFGAPGFVRLGTADPDRPLPRLLHAMSVDLMRAPDGTWQVTGQHASRLGDIGSLIECRRQMETALGEMFGGYDCERHGAFFENWQDALGATSGASDTQSGESRVALLSRARQPGWRDDDVALARGLGASLVEPRDLAVRDGALWIKTVRGLRPIDVLLLQADVALIDPLEFADGIGDGISGVIEAARAGHVRLINDPRAALIETPGLGAVMPAIARTFSHLPPELRDMPQSLCAGTGCQPTEGGDAMWWRSATDPHAGVQPMTAEAPRGLRVEYPASNPSTLPRVGREGLAPAPFMLRMFLMHDGNGWNVLPGGIARSLSEPAEGRAIFHPLAKAERLHDVWVEAEENARILGPQGVGRSAPSRTRGEGDLPSRAADDFFWLGRYVEQLETGVRVLSMVASRLARARPSPRERAELDLLFGVLGEWYPRLVWPGEGAGLSLLTGALAPLFADDERLKQLLELTASLATALRDRITVDMFEMIRDEVEALRLRAAVLGPELREGRDGELQAFCRHALRFCAMFAGFTSENMVRFGARQFLDLGRRIERSAQLCLLVGRVTRKLEPASPGRTQDALRLGLALFDSALTYRARHGSGLRLVQVFELLFADDGNPRSFLFQTRIIEETMLSLDVDARAAHAVPIDDLLADSAALSEAAICLCSDLENAASDGPWIDIPARLEALRTRMFAFSRHIMRHYFVVLAAHALNGSSGHDAEPPS